MDSWIVMIANDHNITIYEASEPKRRNLVDACLFNGNTQ